MKIFEISKQFPKEEQYSLTDQIRRSSRSVCANLAESYGKRRYQKNFISKLTDCDSENLETQAWLEFAYTCDYIDQKIFRELIKQNEAIGKLIYYMIHHPDKFGSK